MSEVSTVRRYLLRAMYVFMFVGLAIFKLPGILQSPSWHIEHRHRGWECARRDRVLGRAGHPVSRQDAAPAVL